MKQDILASSSSLYTHVNHPAHKTRRVYSVRAISSPVSFGRWVNTASISSLASDVVRVSASLNSWPSPVSTDLTHSCCGLGAYRVLVVLHLLLLYRDGDDGLLWEVRGAYDVLWINGRSKTRSDGGKSRLKLLLLSHAWARSKLSQMGCLLESMPQRHGRLSGGNWIFYCSWITPWPSTYPEWTIKDLFRMFELARKRLQDIFRFPCIFSQDQQTHKKLP